MAESSKRRPVRFRFDQEKAAEAVVYLASKQITDLDKYKLSKLLFLAEKLHLVQYGRPITGDEYCALPYGPVPSSTLNLLNETEKGNKTVLSEAIHLDRTFSNPRYKTGEMPFSFGELSKSDKQALDIAISRHRNKSFDELKAITHEMPAYKKAWDTRGNKKSVTMDFEDFFLEDSDAIEGTLGLMIEDAPYF